MTSPHSYTTAEVAQATGFTVRQLDYWAKQGLLLPSIQQSHGPGTRRLYSAEDLIQLQFIRQLRRYGWSLQKIRTAIDALREVMNDPNPLKHAILFHDKKTIIALYKTKEGERILFDTLSAGKQQVMGIVLELLMEEAIKTMASRDSSKATKEVIQWQPSI